MPRPSATAQPEAAAPDARPAAPLLTVVVPVYNGGDRIVDNVEVIRRTVVDGLEGAEVELIVVSDGSIDGSGERLLEAHTDTQVRVIHYDRNLGKGYAVKAGALAAHGDWIALVDGDLDLDPAAIPRYLEEATSDGLDFAIGSKRHVESIVHYPRSRRAASWLYQQLNRVLFRLDVRDTQVGLKVFSRGVADEVLPLLIVKRFAFDLELLAVATALGYSRIRELPVRLDYRFTGSGVRSLAVLGALWDTFAIFYRLRILRTYERKRRLLRRGTRLAPEQLPLVTLIADADVARSLDYPQLEVVGGADPAEAATAAHGELVAVLARGARPAGNWVSAAVPFFSDPEVAAVIAPSVAPLRASLAGRVAAAARESRLGAGSRRMLYLPGNVRTVSDRSAESAVIRREDYLAALAAGVDDDRLVAWLAGRGRRTIYTPDTSVSAPPPPFPGPHLRRTFRDGRARGAVARATRGGSVSWATALSLAPLVAAVGGIVLLAVGGGLAVAGAVLVLAYLAALVLSGVHAAARFRSPAVGLLEPLAVVASQAAYLGGFLRGVAERRSRGAAS